MFQVYIWGAGYYVHQVINEIDYTKVNILGILDHDKGKQEAGLIYSIPVISPFGIEKKEFDYLIISAKNYKSIEDECRKLEIVPEKIIVYWKENHNSKIFVNRAQKVEELIKEKKRFQYRLDSAPYEWGLIKTPQIRKGAEVLDKIKKDHSSLCRFGDGEFEMIREKSRPWFQEPDMLLSKRLKEVLLSKENYINIAIAQNFVGFEVYKEKDADAIREYMFGDTRDFILKLVDMDRVYYDTYVTRPYIIYKDKKNADEIFSLFKELWKDREVVIIEGKYSRIGIDNGLMDNTCSISRILCPSQNAWKRYEIILDTILKKVSKNSLICISLGPCATVLAYDLAKVGYQALDIGQLDNEYEWYIHKAKERIEIPGKMVAEISGNRNIENYSNETYNSQIIAVIE